MCTLLFTATNELERSKKKKKQKLYFCCWRKGQFFRFFFCWIHCYTECDRCSLTNSCFKSPLNSVKCVILSFEHSTTRIYLLLLFIACVLLTKKKKTKKQNQFFGFSSDVWCGQKPLKNINIWTNFFGRFFAQHFFYSKTYFTIQHWKLMIFPQHSHTNSHVCCWVLFLFLFELFELRSILRTPAVRHVSAVINL